MQQQMLRQPAMDTGSAHSMHPPLDGTMSSPEAPFLGRRELKHQGAVIEVVEEEGIAGGLRGMVRHLSASWWAC